MTNLDALLPDLIRERDRLDRVITAILDKNGDGRAASATRPNRYKGMSAMDAAESYVRENREIHIPLAQIIEALVMGNADPGKGRRAHDSAKLISHTLRIGIPNKLKIFDFEPKDVAKKSGRFIIPKGVPNNQVRVWLAPSADVASSRKRATHSRKPSPISPSENEIRQDART